MQVTETHSEGLTRGFKVVVPAKIINERLTVKLTEYGQKVKMPGFRPGKIPMPILKQRFSGHFMGEVVQETVAESSTQALAERDLRPAQQPKIEITEFDQGGDLEYTMDVEVLPGFEVMDLSKVKLTRKVAEVDDASMNEALDRLAENNKLAEAISGKRASKSGDVLLIDFAGEVDGEAKPGMAGEDHELELGSNSFIPGFEDQLIGKKAGDDIDVKVTFPDPYHSQELAGKEAIFKVKVKEIREYQVPKIDDELAKKMGLETLAELKDIVKEQLENEFNDISREAIKRDLLDVLSEGHDFAVPEGMVENEFKDIWRNVEHAMEHGHLSADDEGKSEDDLKEEYRDIAERRVRLGLVFSEIGNEANVEVSQEEVTRALFAEAQKYPGQQQQVFEFYQKNPDALAQLKAPIYEEKVVDYIIDQTNVTEKKVTPEELRTAPEDPNLAKKAKKKAAPKKKAAAKKAPAKKAEAKKPAAKKAAPKKKAAAKKDTAPKKTAAKSKAKSKTKAKA